MAKIFSVFSGSIIVAAVGAGSARQYVAPLSGIFCYSGTLISMGIAAGNAILTSEI